MRGKLIAAGLATIGLVAAGVTIAQADADRQEVGVNWHPQQAASGREGPLEDGRATLVRNKEKITYRFHATDLIPGNAYTLWLVVVNERSACEGSPCTGPDVLTNPETRSQVLFADGLVADQHGRGIFKGSASPGPLPPGFLPTGELEDPMTAEVHLVVNDHGPVIDEFMPGMIETYRGGCSDESPFPPIFPQAALDDGAVGPNTCLLYQSAIFVPEG